MILPFLLTLSLLGPLWAPPTFAAPEDEAAAAGVAAPLAREVALRAVERGVDPRAVLAPVIAAARARVPVEPVAAKVLEGLAKGAPPERVAAVAGQLVERLAAAGALLTRAQAGGLPLRGERAAALDDLAAALAQGVAPEAVEALLGAARAARGGTVDAAIAAARALGELARRGVPVSDALPLGAALAGHPGPAGRVAALWDEYVAEGGRDPRPFLLEAERRAAAGASLEGMVDHFGESPDRVVRIERGAVGPPEQPGAPGVSGARARGPREGGPGTPPGLERTPPGRERGRKLR